MRQPDVSSAAEAWLSNIPAELLAGCRPELFRLVRQNYASPGRYYHTWTHVLACLALFLTLRFDGPVVVFFALLFHDAVYAPGRRDNEQASAALAEDSLMRYTSLPLSQRALVGRLIRLTADHHAVGPSLSHDAAKFLDIDLSILGSPWNLYADYMEGIKKEYCPLVVSERDYPIERMKFLRTLLAQPTIFYSSELKPSLELAARKNIAAEIDLLGAETT